MLRRISQGYLVTALICFGITVPHLSGWTQQGTLQERSAEIEKAYRDCLRLDPSNLHTYQALATFFRAIAKPEKALETLREAARNSSSDEAAACYFAELPAARKSAEAAEIAALLTHKWKSQPALYGELGREFLAKGDIAAAKKMGDFGMEAVSHAGPPYTRPPALSLLLGDLLARQGQLFDAEIEWKRAAFTTGADNPSVQAAMDRLIDAMPALAKHNPAQAGVLFGQAQSTMWTNPQAALLEIQEAIRLNPDGGYLYQSLLAQCLARTGQREAALNEMHAAVKADPDDFSLLELYNMLSGMGRTQEGVDAVKSSRKNRKVTGLYIMALQSLEQRGRLKEGMPLADMAITSVENHVGAHVPMDCAAYVLKADILMLQGKSASAKTFWKRAIDFPVQEGFWKERARMNLRAAEAASKPGDADTVPQPVQAKLAPELAPDVARQHWMKSREYGKAGNLAGQIRELREAARLFPDPYYHSELSGVLANQGLQAEQLAELLEAARLGDDTDSLRAYNALITAGKKEEAIAVAEKGALHSPHRAPQLYVILGNYYLDRGEFESALKMAEDGFAAEAEHTETDIYYGDLIRLKAEAQKRQGQN